MKLLAISDLHVDFPKNFKALDTIGLHPEDWLILGGDICSKSQALAEVLQKLTPCFKKLIWVPGNHELWARPDDPIKGEKKYAELCKVCADHGVLTPEDPYPELTYGGTTYVIAPLFLLYDYSFRPSKVSLDGAIPWAVESGVLCRDEQMISPEPYQSKLDWCHARVAATQKRLSAIGPNKKTVLINHFPLREDLVRLYKIPRFSIWCGTKLTEDWHTRYNAAVVVSGHLHMRATDWRDGVRFEEVALGYPKHWKTEKGMAAYLRTILPEPPGDKPALAGPEWHR